MRHKKKVYVHHLGHDCGHHPKDKQSTMITDDVTCKKCKEWLDTQLMAPWEQPTVITDTIRGPRGTMISRGAELIERSVPAGWAGPIEIGHPEPRQFPLQRATHVVPTMTRRTSILTEEDDLLDWDVTEEEFEEVRTILQEEGAI